MIKRLEDRAELEILKKGDNIVVVQKEHTHQSHQRTALGEYEGIDNLQRGEEVLVLKTGYEVPSTDIKTLLDVNKGAYSDEIGININNFPDIIEIYLIR